MTATPISQQYSYDIVDGDNVRTVFVEFKDILYMNKHFSSYLIKYNYQIIFLENYWLGKRLNCNYKTTPFLELRF